MNFSRRFLIFVVVVCCAGGGCRSRPQVPSENSVPAGEPAVADLIRNAEQTRQRLTREDCVWSCSHDLPDDKQMRVDWASTPNGSRVSFRMAKKSTELEMARIIERDDVWYATEYLTETGTPLGKFRAFETLFSATTLYLDLQLSRLRYATSELLEGARYESTKGGVAKYRLPLDPQRAALLDEMEKGIEQTLTQLSDDSRRKDYEEALREIGRERSNGRSIEIDLASGTVHRYTYSGQSEMEVTFHGPEWNPVPDEELDVSGVSWKDYTADPTKGVDPNDLMLISTLRGWKPGMPGGDTDCCVLNVRTGEYRRVPFAGVASLPGCFLKDRSRVVVSGLDALGGTNKALYEIDLRTGANRLLGDEQLRRRICLGPCLSPDGRTLAFASSDAGSMIMLAGQIMLLDLATNKTHAIDKPFYTSSLSWLLSGKGLILVERKTINPLKPSNSTICRMDLKGERKKIRKGDSPVLLADGKTILYEDNGEWFTCNLKGKNSRRYARNMPKAGFPSPCPDGKRIFWMALEDRPIPCVAELGSAELKPITRAQGRWAHPQWR